MFFPAALMLLRVIVLYSVYLFAFSASSDFLRWFSPSLQDESRSLFNSCENQSRKIHVLFAVSEPLLEYGTIQKSSEKYIERVC